MASVRRNVPGGEACGRGALRFIAAGPAGAGKSTLIGRLLDDPRLVFEDRHDALAGDFESVERTADGDDDVALAADPASAAREQTSTIDVAYRSFTTPNRSFIVADAPEHADNTRAIAAGALRADLAILLIDARKGVRASTKRHSLICSLCGIRHVIVAVNKIDLTGFDQDGFDHIVADYLAFAQELGFTSVVAVPVSARAGDNVTCRSCNTPWYHGPALLERLEQAEVDNDKPAPAGASDAPQVADQFAAHVIWMDREPLMAGRSYLIRIGTGTVPGSVTAIKHKIDPNTREHIAAHTLAPNDIGFCNVSVSAAVAFGLSEDRRGGVFTIIDRRTSEPAGIGRIAFALRRAANIRWQPLLVGKSERAALKAQKPAILWFTGLPGAGKSTLANLVEQRLCAASRHTMLLDGDNVRHGLNRDLGFTAADRVENIRRVGEVAKLMLESGLIVICSFISPYRAERDLVRALVAEGEFIEVFVDTPLAECIKRDPKGLYAKAQAGALKNLTGIDAPYEPPSEPEVHLRTLAHAPAVLADRVIAVLRGRGVC